MYCKKCGASILDDSRFCNHCGTVVSPMAQQPTALQSQFFQQINPQAPVPKKKKKTGLIVLILVLVVLLAAGAVGAVFLLNQNKKDKLEIPEETLTGYYNAIKQCDADLMLSLVPKAYQDYLMEKYDLDNSSLKKAVQNNLKDTLASMKNSCDGDIELSVTPKNTISMDQAYIDNINNRCNEENIPLKVDSGYGCIITLNISKDNTLTENYIVIELDGEWYSQDALEFVSLAAAKDD